MATTHIIFQPLRMASQDVASYDRVIVSATDLDNGALVIETTPAASSFISGAKDMNAYTATAPAAVATDKLLIVDSSEVAFIDGEWKINTVDPRRNYVPAGIPAKARQLMQGDEFLVSATAFASAPTVGEWAVGANGLTTFAPSGTLPTTATGFYVAEAVNFSVGRVNVAGYRLKVL